ncbi:MAG: LexA family transcriptional regulator [Kiloniellales bacterium]|nr:LexA family transcriptional regulator [Kiloniellales bacterium]
MAETSAAARNLKRLRERSGLSVREVAAAIERPASTYASYEDKYRKPYLPLELAKQLEAVLVGRGAPAITSNDVLALAGVTRALFAGETAAADGERPALERGPQRRRPRAADTAAALAPIPELDVRALAGGGAIPDLADPQAMVAEWQIPFDFLRSHTPAAPASLRIIRVHGDSMVPDFRPGERVLVNTDDRLPSPPGVFIVWDGFGLVIKRLEVIPYSEPATVRLISANADYAVYERPLEDVTVNGRVIGRWQWT